jgi:hypothetical protein
MRILAIVYCYPPMRVPASLCYLKLVCGLAELGHRVDIVTIDPLSFEWISEDLLDPDLMKLRPTGVREHRVWSPEGSLPIRLVKRFGFTRELFHRFLEPRKSEWVLSARWTLRKLRGSDFDVVLSCSQPHANHLLGRWIQKRTGLPWVAYFSDPWIGNVYSKPMSTRALQWNIRQEADVLAKADRILFTSQEMLNSVAERYPHEVTQKLGVLPHCFVPAWFGGEGSAREHDPNRPVVFLHTGHFYGPRTPTPFFKGIEELHKRGRIEGPVRFEFYGSMKEDHRRYVDRPGLRELVGVHEPVGYLDSLKLMRRSDVLVVIDAPVGNGEESVFLPSKLIDYLGSGREILGVTPEKGATARFLKGKGFTTCPGDDVERVAEAIAAAITKARRGGGTQVAGEEYDYMSVAGSCADILMQASSAHVPVIHSQEVMEC